MKDISKTKVNVFLILIISISVSFVVYRLEDAKYTQIELAKQKVVNNAVTHYFDLVNMRQWNAMTHGVYIKPQDENIKPNPYLKNNMLRSSENELLIRVNPAWMTRQISEIANKNGDHFFKITSLKPLNPNNAADEFETEALQFFEKNKQQKHYYQFNDDFSQLDFMGSLVTTEACLDCHAEQGYKVGDIRGGIRISSPNEDLKQEVIWLKNKAQENNAMVILSAFVIMLLLLRVNNIVFAHQKKIEKLNKQLALEKQLEQNLNEELKQAQVNLIQAEKMASVGQLAAGVAHEINNPLGYIYSNLNALHKYAEDLWTYIDATDQANNELADDNPNKAKLQKIKDELDIGFIREDIGDLLEESLEGVGKAKAVIENLREFTGIDKQRNQLINIEEGLEATLVILEDKYNGMISIIKEFSGVKPINANGAQLNQVFMGVLLNAIQSIEGQGTIYIRTAMESNQWVRIEIEDTGKGIPKEIQGKVFDPFFTNKPVGEGTGLGLSIAYQFIDAHKGRINLDSVVDKGTKVTIVLPLLTQT